MPWWRALTVRSCPTLAFAHPPGLTAPLCQVDRLGGGAVGPVPDGRDWPGRTTPFGTKTPIGLRPSAVAGWGTLARAAGEAQLARRIRIVVGEGRTAQRGLLRFVLEGEGFDVVGEAEASADLSGVIEAQAAGRRRPRRRDRRDGRVDGPRGRPAGQGRARVARRPSSRSAAMPGSSPPRSSRTSAPAVEHVDGRGRRAHGDVRAARVGRQGPQGPRHAAGHARCHGGGSEARPA